MCCPKTRQQENRGGAESTPVDRGRPVPREGRQKAIEPGLATLNLGMRRGRCQVRDGGGVHYSFGELRTTREGYQTVGQISARQNRQRKRLHRKIFTARRNPGPLGGVDVCRYYVCLSALGGAKEAGRRVGGPGCVMSGAAYNNQTLMRQAHAQSNSKRPLRTLARKFPVRIRTRFDTYEATPLSVRLHTDETTIAQMARYASPNIVR